MKFRNNFLKVLPAAALALAVAGCGGGGDDGPPEDTSAADAAAARATAQRTALTSAATAVGTALATLPAEDVAQGQVDAANTAVAALEAAIDNAADVPAEEVAGYQGQVTAAKAAITSAQERVTAEATAAALAEEKATTARARALTAALTAASTVPVTGTGSVTSTGGIPVITATGVDPTLAIPLEAGDAAGSLGDWSGTNYAGTSGTTAATKATGTAVIYSNADAPKSHRFDSEAGNLVHMLMPAINPADTPGDYYVSDAGAAVGTDPAATSRIGGFPTTGTHSYDDGDTVSGTYMKASGTYTCIEASAGAGCEAASAGDSGTDLSAGWNFTPSSGAMLQQRDSQYLYFGWWLRENNDGPTHAGVLYGEVMPTTGTSTVIREAGDTTGPTGNDRINSPSLVGKATYAGKAAGKFAIRDLLRPANDDAGHFTADAELMADFKDGIGTNLSTLSGTIDNFRLNDGSGDPNWSVELQETMFVDGSNKFATASTTDRTVWSIGTSKGGSSGAWEAEMHDEADADSNVPTSVVGAFQSSFGATHSMVGAFGATKEE